MNRLIAPVLMLLASAVPAFASTTVVLPEPATLAVLGAGVGGVYLIRRFTGRK
jgi:hypothetical protein